jgi:hypothetical protein
VSIVATLVHAAMRRVSAYLNQPYARYVPTVTADIDQLRRVLLPGDVILVDGNTRFAALVKHLTQSTWSHVAMYVGPLSEQADPLCIVEADIEYGVRGIALSELRGMHVRIVRAAGLGESKRAEVARQVAARIGQIYDFDCAFGLARSLWPLHGGPTQCMPIATPNRAICSTLLAHAFEAVGYPILPQHEHAELRVHTPRDFDLSPFFAVVPLLGLRRTRAERVSESSRMIPARPASGALFSAPVPRQHWSCRRPSRRVSTPHGLHPLPRTSLPGWPSQADSRSSAGSRA